MTKAKSIAKKGFTLIEFVIVVALAALLMLGVLQATGSARRSQRDSQRKNDFGRIQSQLQQYASNHGGKFPRAAAGKRANDGTVVFTATGNATPPATSVADEEFLDGFVGNYALDITTPDEYLTGANSEKHAPYTFYTLGENAPVAPATYSVANTPSDCRDNATCGTSVVTAVATTPDGSGNVGWKAGLPQTAVDLGANRVFYTRGSWDPNREAVVAEPGKFSIWMVMEGGISGFTQDNVAVNDAGNPQ